MAVPRSGDKGSDLEEILKTYFWQSGYFVVRGVPYRLEDEDVTDVDLWLYERPAASTRRRLIVDAKNRKSPKAAERIIWTRGLQAALGVDGAIVATTDKRAATRRLAKSLNVILLDGDAIAKLSHSEQLKKAEQIRTDDLNFFIKKVDNSRRSVEWRQIILDARTSLISAFGIQSVNRNLAASSFFAEQAVMAQPKSEQAQLALRLFYQTSAFAIISLDFILADHAFRPQEDRRQLLMNGIRYGQSEVVAALPTVRAAIGLARKYADNGNAIAKQIEYGFNSDAERIPAEIIADHVARIASFDTLFNVARELERASSGVELLSFDHLSIDSKSLLGVFLDFNGIARETVANAWPRVPAISHPSEVHSGLKEDVGPLFGAVPRDENQS